MRKYHRGNKQAMYETTNFMLVRSASRLPTNVDVIIVFVVVLGQFDRPFIIYFTL